MNPSIVKRCLVGAVLAIAATLPGFQQLHTSVEGLKLIADYEGCRLQPYQCSAGVWTDGIGNTSGVIPGKTITERQAAEGLILLCLLTLSGCGNVRHSPEVQLTVSGCPRVTPCRLDQAAPRTNGDLNALLDETEVAWAVCADKVDMIIACQERNSEQTTIPAPRPQ